MPKKLLLPFLVLLFLALFASPTQAGKTYHVENYDVHIEVHPSRAIIVTETIELHFDGGPFTNFFREISRTETDGITFLEASMDGFPMLPGINVGQVEANGDPLRVTWHFSPTSDAIHLFVVRYRVDGVIRKGQEDTLIWRFIPEKHEYSITNASVTLHYPQDLNTTEPPVLDRVFVSKETAFGLRLITHNLAADQTAILTAKFPPDSQGLFAPLWQAQQEEESAAIGRTLPTGLLSGLVTILLGGLGLFTRLRTNKRMLKLPPKELQTTPPQNISPILVAKLTGQAQPFTVTLFDLAQRGLLEVREEQESLGAKSQYLVPGFSEGSLNAYEQVFWDAIFKPGETQVGISEVTTRLASNPASFDKHLEQELITRGWIDPQRQRNRAILIEVSLLILLVALGVLIGATVATQISLTSQSSQPLITAALAGFGGGVFVLAIILLIYAAAYSPLTPSGEEQKVGWQSFAGYLKRVSKSKKPVVGADYFERYLTYALVFGLGADWIRYFQNLGGSSLPNWFHALSGGDTDFGAMVAFMTAVEYSAYAGGADTGASGASGGGSSGAS